MNDCSNRQVEVLQQQIAEMHELIERLKAGARQNRYTAPIELAIDPCFSPNAPMYYIGREGLNKPKE